MAQVIRLLESHAEKQSPGQRLATKTLSVSRTMIRIRYPCRSLVTLKIHRVPPRIVNRKTRRNRARLYPRDLPVQNALPEKDARVTMTAVITATYSVERKYWAQLGPTSPKRWNWERVELRLYQQIVAAISLGTFLNRQTVWKLDEVGLFRLSGQISTQIFPYNFKTACDSNGVHEATPMAFFHISWKSQPSVVQRYITQK